MAVMEITTKIEVDLRNEYGLGEEVVEGMRVVVLDAEMYKKVMNSLSKTVRDRVLSERVVAVGGWISRME